MNHAIRVSAAEIIPTPGGRHQGENLIGIADALRALRSAEQVSYILDSRLNLACHNRAWDKFAVENSAPELARGAAIGKNVLSVTDESLRPFYRDAFHQVASEKTVWEWEYECSSPQVLRKFLMRIHPITPSNWFLVTNSIVVEAEHSEGNGEFNGYVNAQGQIQLCVHCRCSKRVAPPERWDFVPANLKPEMANVRQDLCPTCRKYFYPALRG